MSQQIKVEAVTKEPRNYNGQINWGVKLPGDGGWITLYRERKPDKGETIDVNITERTGKDGKKYRDAFPVMPALAPEPSAPVEPAKPPKQITWDDYRELMKAAHGVALVLEPDEYGEEIAGIAHIRSDRSTARAAIMNTALIAFSNGKFIVPKDDDDEYVPPDDDDAPPFLRGS